MQARRPFVCGTRMPTRKPLAGSVAAAKPGDNTRLVSRLRVTTRVDAGLVALLLDRTHVHGAAGGVVMMPVPLANSARTRLYSRYGPSDRSATQCHKASVPPVIQRNRSSASGPIDNLSRWSPPPLMICR
jgi:hypothetical protein